MSKYRTLTTEELEPLKKEFIYFLSANTITGNDWNLLKKNKPKQAEKLLALFSDDVWERSLEKIICLEYRGEKELCVFLCKKEKILLVGFRVNAQNSPSLLYPETIRKLATGNLTFSSLKASFYTSEKNYNHSRSKDLFLMIESGYTPCDIETYNGILSLTKQKTL